MKKIWCFCFSFVLLSFAHSQEQYFNLPGKTIKWAATGLLLGDISIQGEYNLKNRHSLTAKVGIPVAVRHTIQYQERDVEFTMRASSFLIGYRTYFADTHLAGLYLEPYCKYVQHQSKGIGFGKLGGKPIVYDFSNRYQGTGFGIQLGYQLLLKEKLIVDIFFFGPEINSSINNFRAEEISQTISWTEGEAKEAETVTRDFINRFPFIKNKADVRVNREKRIIYADFMGALPGIRTGVSIGLAF